MPGPLAMRWPHWLARFHYQGCACSRSKAAPPPQHHWTTVHTQQSNSSKQFPPIQHQYFHKTLAQHNARRENERVWERPFGISVRFLVVTRLDVLLFRLDSMAGVVGSCGGQFGDALPYAGALHIGARHLGIRAHALHNIYIYIYIYVYIYINCPIIRGKEPYTAGWCAVALPHSPK